MNKSGKTVAILALTTFLSFAGNRADAKDVPNIFTSSDVPLTIQLQNLDNTWRKINVSGQYELGDFMKNWGNLLGGYAYNNTYYTQGKTKKFGGETYLIAYRLQPQGEPLSLQSLISSSSSNTCDEDKLPKAITETTTVHLAFLNLNTIGSLNDVVSVNIADEINSSQKQYQEAIAVCKAAELQEVNYTVESNLYELSYAVLGYSEGHNGKLPNLKDAATAQSDLSDLVSTSSVFVHPKTNEPYQPNAKLSGKILADIPNPDKTILFYELTPAVDGTRGVLFLDTSVRRISAEDWDKVKQESGL